MLVISTCRCRLLWNDEALNFITPSRGLCQGDPLSPFLFILCMERLCHWIQLKVEQGSWRALKASRSGPIVLHLFFAYALFLFAEASEDQVDYEGLDLFCNASSLCVNYYKSLMFVSPNICEQDAQRLSLCMGILLTKKLGSYLGHHITHQGGSQILHEKVLQKHKDRLAGWKSKNSLMSGPNSANQVGSLRNPYFLHAVRKISSHGS